MFLFVSVAAFLRQPLMLVHEEPQMVGSWFLEPNNGQFTILRAAFLLPSPELTSRIVAALIIGAVALLLLTRTEAIPDARVRLVAALALPLLPLPDPGPYTGPLNGQWWLALGVLLLALSPLRRWHYPAIILAGLSGIAPCLVVPVFRDRRGLVLAGVAAIQVVVLLTSGRGAHGLPSIGWLAVMAALAGAMTVARLPARTRLAFLYLGLVVLALGAFSRGEVEYRYLAIPLVGIVLGLASLALVAKPAAAATTTTAGGDRDDPLVRDCVRHDPLAVEPEQVGAIQHVRLSPPQGPQPVP